MLNRTLAESGIETTIYNNGYNYEAPVRIPQQPKAAFQQLEQCVLRAPQVSGLLSVGARNQRGA